MMLKGFIMLSILTGLWVATIILSGRDTFHHCRGCNRCFRNQDEDSDLR